MEVVTGRLEGGRGNRQSAVGVGGLASEEVVEGTVGDKRQDSVFSVLLTVVVAVPLRAPRKKSS